MITIVMVVTDMLLVTVMLLLLTTQLLLLPHVHQRLLYQLLSSKL